VHPFRIGAVVVAHACRNAFAKIGLEGVHAHVQQGSELRRIPGPRLRVGEVHPCAAGLPVIHLVDVPVERAQQIAVSRAFLEQGRGFGNVGVDPQADFDVPVSQAAQHPGRIGEVPPIPQEAAPCQFLHPKAVEVEDADGNAQRLHALDVVQDGLFVVVGGEGRGQPQAERPFRRQGRAAAEPRVLLQGIFHGRPAEEVVVQAMLFHAELDARDMVRADLKRHATGMVDQQAVPLAGEVEGDVLVGVLGIGAAVLIPHVDRLAVLDQRAETLAQAVDRLADRQRELLAQVSPAILLQQGDGLRLAAGQRAAIAPEGNAPLAAHIGRFHRQAAGPQPDAILVAPDRDAGIA